MRRIAEQECAAAEARGETGYPAMWAADRLEVIEDCLRWLEAEREDPRTRALPHGACEARFGARHPGEEVGELSRDDPIEIALPTGDVLRLSGRIDRIAWAGEPPSRFRVVDYKTGRVRDEKPGQLQGGRMLQLPLYVLAGAQLLAVDPRQGEAAYVYPTRRGGFQTVDRTGEELAERHDQVLSVLAGILDGIGRGDFMVAPHKPDSACRYCDFDAICPHPREPYVKRKAGDPRLAPFAEQVRSVP
jgi:ATP-dependent helicase/DNAse subunit B